MSHKTNRQADIAVTDLVPGYAFYADRGNSIPDMLYGLVEYFIGLIERILR
jgi:hypothetical protein